MNYVIRTLEAATASPIDNIQGDTIGVIAKAIPLGAELSGNDLKLKFTIQFTPVDANQSDIKVKLSDWVKGIHNLCGQDLNILLYAESGVDARPIREAKISFDKLFTALPKSKANNSTAPLTGLWQQTFTTYMPDDAIKPIVLKDGEADKLWLALARSLSDSAKGLGLSVQMSKNESGDVDAAKGAKNFVTEILVNEQRMQAVSLEMARARELIDTLNGKDIYEECCTINQLRQLNPLPAKQPADKPDDKVKETGRSLLADARAAELSALEASWAGNAKQDGRKAYLKAYNDLNPKPLFTPQQSPARANPANCKSSSDLAEAAKSYIDSHAYTTWQNPLPQNRPDPKEKVPGLVDNEPNPNQPTAERRFYNLQSTPSLARLFLLAVDAEATIPVAGLADSQSLWLRIMLPQEKNGGENVVTKTLAGLNKTDGGWFFMPAQRQSMGNDQKNGLLLIGQPLDGDNPDNIPRFDLSSLHITAATERAYERSRRRTETDLPKDIVEAPPTAQRDTYHTGGFAILDGDRRNAVARRLAARTYQNEKVKGGIVELDADDLLVGYMIDAAVGVVRNGAIASEWRPLMYRKVDYQHEHNFVRELLGKLIGRPDDDGETERMLLDAAVLAPHIKLSETPRPKEKTDPSDDKTRECIADQLIGTWDGGPMGVNCAGSVEEKTDNEDLPIGRKFGLPTLGSFTAQRARIDRAYRMAMRPVYQAGVVISLNEAKALYDSGPDYAFPPGAFKDNTLQSESFRRFLRQERIGPPHLLLPASLAVKANGYMGYESAKLAVIRTVVPPKNVDAKPAHDDLATRATPIITHRYFMPPGVDQALAALHGVFDGQDKAESKISGVVTTPKKGGFPAVANITSRGLNGEQYVSERKFLDIKKDATTPAESIFATTAAKDPDAYYPDPMAQLYVVAAKLTGGKDYVVALEKPVPVYDAGHGSVIPLKIVVSKLPKKGKPAFSAPRDIFVSESISGILPQSIKVREVTLTLAPGQDLEVDVWCIPVADALAQSFSVIEMVGVLAAKDIEEGQREPNALKANLKQLLATNQQCLDFLERSDFGTKEMQFFSGPYGMKAPGRAELKLIGQMIHQCLLKKPLPELTSVATMRAVHAVNLPQVGDPFAEDGKNPITARYMTAKRLDAFKAADEKDRPGFLISPDTAKILDPDEGGHDLVLAGPVEVDLDTASAFKIHADTVFPRTTLFDDLDRGRSAVDRRDGTWPYESRLEYVKETQTWKEEKRYLPTAVVYGFQVAADGSVELPKTRVTLLSVSDLPPGFVQAGATDGGGSATTLDVYETVNLEDLYGKELPPSLKGARVKLEHAFPDGKARRLMLLVETITRFASLMTTAPRLTASGQFIPAEPLDAGSDSVLSDLKREVWLNATIRPSKPVSHAPFYYLSMLSTVQTPALLAKGKFTVAEIRRKSKIRIPVRRGSTMTSGQDEKVAVVLWPPNIFDLNEIEVAGNNYRVEGGSYAGTGDLAESRRLDLSDFSDEDLGLGGPFITRCGKDPIRDGGEAKGQFVPVDWFNEKNSFVSLEDYLKDSSAAQGKVIRVRAAKMPIRKPSSDDAREGPSVLHVDSPSKESDLEFMTVSLLAYTPKFDIDSEEWYIDVDFSADGSPDPFLRFGLVNFQPHAAKLLQVSEPTVEWVQILPERVLTISEPVDGVLPVTVSGTASTGAAIEASSGGSLDWRMQRPHVKMELMAEVSSPQGLLRYPVFNMDSETGQVTISTKREPTAWNGKLGLGNAYKSGETSLPQWASLYVQVTEYDLRQRSWQKKEPAVPVPPDQKQQNFRLPESTLERVPRFVARIDIPGDWKNLLT